MIDPDREAFSTAPHDDEYAPVQDNDKDELDRLGRFDAEMGSGSNHPYEPASYDNAYARPHVEDEDDAPTYSAAGYRPNTVEPDADTSYAGANGGKAQFPHAPY